MRNNRTIKFTYQQPKEKQDLYEIAKCLYDAISYNEILSKKM